MLGCQFKEISVCYVANIEISVCYVANIKRLVCVLLPIETGVCVLFAFLKRSVCYRAI